MSAPATSGQASVPRELVLVEDNPGDARLVVAMLRRGWTRNLNVHSFTTLGEAVAHLETSGADCVLLDLSLPDSQGVEGVRRVASHFPALPVVVLSGTNEEALVLECLQEGAQDYLVKGQVEGEIIGRAIRYAVERKRSERELQGAGHGRRHAYRLSTVGVGLVLTLLAAFSIGAATVSKRSAAAVERATVLSAAYGQAVQAVSEQDRLLVRFALAGGRSTAQRTDHRRAAETLTDGLDGVRLSGREEDRVFAEGAAIAHGRYLQEAEEVFASAQAGQSPDVLARRVEAAADGFASAEQRLIDSAAAERGATVRRAARLARDDDLIFVATLVAFSVGLLLLGLFGGAMRAYRGRFEQARRTEFARRARSAPPAGVQAELDAP